MTKDADENIKIITIDADMLQLISSKVTVELFRKGKRELYNEARFNEEYGINPSQLADFKGLRGDTSDNIPGVQGIGSITARRLLTTYKNLDEIYENISCNYCIIIYLHIYYFD